MAMSPDTVAARMLAAYIGRIFMSPIHFLDLDKD